MVSRSQVCQTMSPVRTRGTRCAWLARLALLAAAVVSSAGCAICCNPYDEDFAAFGGVRDRIDRRWGRVGSILDPAESIGTDRLVPVERSFVPAAGFRTLALDRPAGEPELAVPEVDLPADEPATDIPEALAPGVPDEVDPSLTTPDAPEFPAEPEIPSQSDPAPPDEIPDVETPSVEPSEPEFNLDDLFDS